MIWRAKESFPLHSQEYQLFMISYGDKHDDQYMIPLIEKDFVAFKQYQTFIIARDAIKDESKLCEFTMENASNKWRTKCLKLRREIMDNASVHEISD